MSVRINGKKLADLRRAFGYNAADDLARKIGCATGTLRRYEGGESIGADPDVLDLIAEAFNKMSRDALLEKIKADPAAGPEKRKFMRVSIPVQMGGQLKQLAGQNETTVDRLVATILDDWLASLSSRPPQSSPPEQAEKETFTAEGEGVNEEWEGDASGQGHEEPGTRELNKRPKQPNGGTC